MSEEGCDFGHKAGELYYRQNGTNLGAYHPSRAASSQAAAEMKILGLERQLLLTGGAGTNMMTTTYELSTAADGSTVLQCLLCHGETSDADSLQRLHCPHCSWFHEPNEQDHLDLLRHIQVAAGEVQAALEIAERIQGDATRIDRLRSALRELRRALSRG
jgi:hypothetical protein